MGLLRVGFPDEALRARATYLFVLTLGYGHLVGAAVSARGRMAAWRPAGIPRGPGLAFAATGLLCSFGAYVLALQNWPVLILPMLGLATWHAFENDASLPSTYAAGYRVGPIAREARSHVMGLGLSSLLLAWFAATRSPLRMEAGPFAPGLPLDFQLAGWLGRLGAAAAACVLLREREGRPGGVALWVAAVLSPWDLAPWLSFADMFGIWTLYHVYSWLILTGERLRALARSQPSAYRRRLRLLLGVHAAPLVLSALLVSGVLASEGLLAVLVFSPGAYLFWSVLHALQTAALRGVEKSETRGVAGVGS